MENQNPLAGYYRTPGVHQALATGGKFFAEGDVELAINGEIAIYPMTALDEIVIKNPDALLNGDALVRLFKSCVPVIKDPKQISVPDMDILLLAIKLASYGDILEVNVKCPECESEFSSETSIRGLLATAAPVKDEDSVVRISDDMVIHIRPYNFEDRTILELATFEETKMFQHLLATDIDDDTRAKIFNRSFEKIAELNLDLLARCIVKIVVPGGEVVEANYIQDFVKNSDRITTKKIQDKLKALSESGVNKELEAECANEECKHQWKTNMVFDPAHFFA